MKSDSYRIKYYIKYVNSISGEKNLATGKAICEVDAPASSVLAWRWDFCSNEKMEIHREDNRSVSRYVKELSWNEAINVSI